MPISALHAGSSSLTLAQTMLGPDSPCHSTSSEAQLTYGLVWPGWESQPAGHSAVPSVEASRSQVSPPVAVPVQLAASGCMQSVAASGRLGEFS